MSGPAGGGRYLVLGGVRSGKSRHAGALAGALAAPSGAPVVYLATGSPSDPELAERIAAHRRARPAGWRTVATREIGAGLREAPDRAVVIIEDLEGWLSARMADEQLWTDAEVAPWGEAGDAARARIVAEATGWWELAGARTGATVLTAGQPGFGVVPAAASVRRWVDLHGELVQVLSGHADRTDLVVAGRAVPLPHRAPAHPAAAGSAAAGPTPAQPAPAGPAPAQPAAAGSATPRPATAGVGDEGGDAAAPDVDLRDHGDRQVPAGAVDLAVNVLPGPPDWLRQRLTDAVAGLAGYPDPEPARRAAAARHGRTPAECLPLHGAAEAFWLLAQVLRPGLAACVHPSFTEGEAALRATGTPVTRVFREPARWTLDPDLVPPEAELVLLGRPDNPTGAVDDPGVLARLCRPGRTVVLDEAFAEFLPDAGGLAGWRGLTGLVVVRSLTKLWGIAGLRVGYLLGEPALVSRLAAARQPWPVSAPALAALAACADPAAESERRDRALRVAGEREALLADLKAVPGLTVWPGAANFLLLRSDRPDLRERLLADGLALRRGDTFPGLDARYLRTAVTDRPTGRRLAGALRRHLPPPIGPEAT